MTSHKRLVLLETDASWQGEAHMEVRWDSSEVEGEQVSIPLHVEKQAVEIKTEYLRMIYEVGGTQIEGKPLTEHLKLFDNLSLWWLTTIAEKTPFLYESIYKVFKLRALEKLYLKEDCTELVYCGFDSSVHRTLKLWCEKMGHVYRHISAPKKSKSDSLPPLRKFFNRLPHGLQALAWLVRRWWLRFRHYGGLEVKASEQFVKSEVTIATIFPNIDMKKAGSGVFRSRYWENLHDLLDQSGLKINWIWFYYATRDMPFNKALELRNTFNEKYGGRQQFHLLEDFLTFRELLKGLRLYLKIYFRRANLEKSREAFCFPRSMMNLFPVLQWDWECSLFGIMSIERIFQGVMFDSMARHLSATPWGLYTWENQPWELSLIAAWRRRHKETRIIAYVHSSVRPMDLRLFMDPEIYRDPSPTAFPLPDILGVNGSAGLSTMRESGYPNEKLERIEALRFFNLSGKYGSERKPIEETNRTLMVVTGVIPHEAYFQLELLKNAWHEGALEKYKKILIKPHPGFAVGSILEDLNPEFDYEVISGIISSYWNKVDVVYCANSSGASLEAAWLGIPLIITLAVNAINLNPMFEFEGIKFVADVSQLVEELEQPRIVEIPDDYFFMDEELKSWKRLLEL
jgi:surface carbohydrate biosynthesis protein (TIGR04326 family)|tara:strand:- start:1635 stop:3518 length:1884 start_codon:yes stop_codon:yes gene_type:complete